MSQTLKTFENALKNVYLPLWNNQLGIEPSVLLSKIKKVPIKGNDIVAAAEVGLSGGFGYGKEGEATPASGNVIFSRFKTDAKDMYVNVCISQKAVKLTGPSGAMADALHTEVQGAYDAAKWNVGRSLFGTGSGKLAKLVNIGDTGHPYVSDGTTIGTNTYVTLKVNDTANLKEGLILDFYASAGTAISAGTGVRLLIVDRVNNQIVISVANTSKSSFSNNDFITVQHSYQNEITGLGAIMYDSNDADYATDIYGLSKAQNPYLNPIVADAGNDISDGIITGALRRAEREKNSKVNLLMAGDAAFDAYVNVLRETNQRIEGQTKKLEGGFTAISFLFGNREVDIVNESFVPSDEMWGVDTTACEFHQTDWTFAELQGGGIFNLMEGQSIYRALLTNYGNLICKNPGGCVRIKNAITSS